MKRGPVELGSDEDERESESKVINDSPYGKVHLKNQKKVKIDIEYLTQMTKITQKQTGIITVLDTSGRQISPMYYCCVVWGHLF